MGDALVDHDVLVQTVDGKQALTVLSVTNGAIPKLYFATEVPIDIDGDVALRDYCLPQHVLDVDLQDDGHLYGYMDNDVPVVTYDNPDDYEDIDTQES